MLAITLEGAPFERGFQHGRRFAAEIRETIRVFCPEHWQASAEVQELERRLLKTLADQAPDLVVEMVGISKGAGLPFDQISLLNLVLATNDLSAGTVTRTFRLACTAVGFRRSKMGPLVGKNCDEMPAAAPFYLFQTVRPDQGLAFMGISWVGTLWLEAGLNEAGFALMQTAGPLVPDQDGYGIVCNIAPRLLMDRCRSVKEGVRRLGEMRVAGWGMGAVLVDAGGELAVVEKTHDRIASTWPEGEAGFMTNHFLDPVMDGTIPTAHVGLEENSRRRYETLTRLFSQADPSPGLEALKGALGYHGELGFVCQHGDAGMHSNYSCIAIPWEKKILLGDGYPCQDHYTEFCL